MKNKTAKECWNILRGQLDSEIDSYLYCTTKIDASVCVSVCKICTSVQCSRGKILVRYLYQKQSSMDQREKGWGS